MKNSLYVQCVCVCVCEGAPPTPPQGNQWKARVQFPHPIFYIKGKPSKVCYINFTNKYSSE